MSLIIGELTETLKTCQPWDQNVIRRRQVRWRAYGAGRRYGLSGGSLSALTGAGVNAQRERTRQAKEEA